MQTQRLLLALLTLVAAVHISSAAETICLKSGFCLDVDSHSAADGRCTLHLGAGTVEVAAEDVLSIDAANQSPQPDRQIATASALTPDLLLQAANQQGLGSYVQFVRSVAKIESGLRQSAISPKGAYGLMQLMPRTAEELGVDPSNTFENALGGAKYLRSLLIRYHGDSALALAAYNAGPSAVDRFHGIPPYEETRSYIVRVLREYQRERRNEPRNAVVSQNRTTAPVSPLSKAQ